MKALSSRHARMRSSQSRASSTEEILPAARTAPSSVSVEFSKLLNDLGDQVQPPFHSRGNGLVRVAPVVLLDLVGARPLDYVESVGHRLDACGVDRLDLADQLEDAVQAAAHFRGFTGLQGDAGEAREAPDLVV